MDMSDIGVKVWEFCKKYRYVILVLVIGIGLMAIPDGAEREPEPTTPVQTPVKTEDQTEALTDILSQIKGAGKVKVLLTLSAGERTIYQTDQDTSSGTDSGSVRHETVLITDGDRAQRSEEHT